MTNSHWTRIFSTATLMALAINPLFSEDFSDAKGVKQHPGANSSMELLSEQLVIARPALISEMGKSGFLKKLVAQKMNLVATLKPKETGFSEFNLQPELFATWYQGNESPYAQKFLGYLNQSPELSDSLKLRRIARELRVKTAATPAIAEWLKKEFDQPIVLLEKSPLPATMGSLGPVFIPIGAQVFDQKSQDSKFIAGSVINLTDIKSGSEVIFSVDDAMANDTLDVVLAHENAHGIMYDLYGKDMAKIRKPSQVGHDAPLITDEGLAFVEGWAEAHEAYYGLGRVDLTQKIEKIAKVVKKAQRAGVKPPVSDFLIDRQDPVRKDSYVWIHHRGQKTGLLKNGMQMLACEGVIAGLFFDFMTSRTIPNAFESIATTMMVHKPLNFREFLKGFIQQFPDSKETALRIFLENTHYVTVSPAMRGLYAKLYQAKLAFHQKKSDGKDYHALKNQYQEAKEKLFQKALGTGDFTSAIQGDIWFEANLKPQPTPEEGFIAKLLRKITGKGTSSSGRILLNLNTAPAAYLRILNGTTEEIADIIAQGRDSVGGFDEFNDIRAVIGEANFAKLVADWQPAMKDVTAEESLATYNGFINLDNLLPKPPKKD